MLNAVALSTDNLDQKIRILMRLFGAF